MNLIRKQAIIFMSLFAVLCLSSTFTYADSDRAGVVNADYLNVRASYGTQFKVVGVLNQNTEVTILDESNGWYKINKGNITGWCKKDFISEKTAGTAWVSADSLNLREWAGESYKVLTVLSKGEKLSVIKRYNDWYNVRTERGVTGWVSEKYISFRSVGSSRGVVDRTSKGEKLVSYAKSFLGVRYVYGGSTPSGFDCSGFVKYVYNHFGYGLERVACDQAGDGSKVSKAELAPGDLVFFDTDGGHNYINHVGIYIGSGNFIHASSGSNTKKVTISDLNDTFYRNAFMTASRIMK